MIFMITLILIITMIVDWLVIIWWWTWFVIMIMPIDSRCLLLIDYDEKQDWWFIDDNWSWMMNDYKGHKWWFIVIDNRVGVKYFSKYLSQVQVLFHICKYKYKYSEYLEDIKYIKYFFNQVRVKYKYFGNKQ